MAEIQRIAEKLQVLAPTPQAQKLPIAPIFITDKVSLAVSREKDQEIEPGLRRMGRCECRRAERGLGASGKLGADVNPQRIFAAGVLDQQ